jgi:hypothetical protein
MHINLSLSPKEISYYGYNNYTSEVGDNTYPSHLTYFDDA